VRQAIQSAESSNLDPKDRAKLQSFAPSLKKIAGTAKSSADSKRLQSLAEILQRPSK
jgi:hypothetical protein